MTQRIAYYQVMFGLPGCIPNSHEFHSWPTRRAMVQGISALLDSYGFPQRARRQISVNEIWAYVQNGGTRGHFVIRGGMGQPCNLEFVQIRGEEYRAAINEGEFC